MAGSYRKGGLRILGNSLVGQVLDAPFHRLRRANFMITKQVTSTASESLGSNCEAESQTHARECGSNPEKGLLQFSPIL